MEFRRFVEACRDQADVAVVRDLVSCRSLPAAVAAEEHGRNRVVLFEDVAGTPGGVASNVFGSSDRINRAVGAADTQAFFAAIDSATRQPSALVMTDRLEDEYVISSNPVILEHVPPIVHSRDDVTPYITSGVVLARNPDSGKHHVCFVRLSIQESNRVLFNPRTPRISEIMARTVGRGKPLDVVILIGAPTEVMVLAALNFPDQVDELEVAQALAGESLSFVRGELPVPLPSEMVLFGRVMPEYRQEGPFGELTGMYSIHSNPVCIIDSLWTRKSHVYHSIPGGVSREHVALVSLKAAHELEKIKARSANVAAYELPRFAAGKLCLVAVTTEFVKADLIRDLSVVPLVRLFILVNQDVSIESADDILWSLTHRTGDSADYHFRDEDPNVGLGKKTIIDATADSPSDIRSKRIELFA